MSFHQKQVTAVELQLKSAWSKSEPEADLEDFKFEQAPDERGSKEKNM